MKATRQRDPDRAGQAAPVMAGFMAFLVEVGADREANPQAKTRWALEYHAARRR